MALPPEKLLVSNTDITHPYGSMQPAIGMPCTSDVLLILQLDLKRALNGRHTALIALASGIGTGLFVRIYSLR